MKKISILVILSLLLVGTVAFGQVMSAMDGLISIGGTLKFGTFIGDAESAGAAIDTDGDGDIDSEDGGVAQGFFGEDTELVFDAQVNEYNSARIAFEGIGVEGAGVATVSVDEATLTSQLGAWWGISSMTEGMTGTGVGIALTSGYYSPGSPERGEVTNFGLEDVMGTETGTALGAFDVGIDVFGIASFDVGVTLNNDEEHLNNIWFALSGDWQVGPGTLGAAVSFGEGGRFGIAESEIGLGLQYDIGLGDISLGFGGQFEYQLNSLTGQDVVDEGFPFDYGTTPTTTLTSVPTGGLVEGAQFSTTTARTPNDPTAAVAEGFLPQRNLQIGAGVEIGVANWLGFGVGFRLRQENEEYNAIAEEALEVDQSDVGLAFNLNLQTPASEWGFDLGVLLALSGERADADEDDGIADYGTFDGLDASLWMSPGSAIFRAGIILNPEDGGNFNIDYNGPQLGADATVVYLSAEIGY